MAVKFGVETREAIAEVVRLKCKKINKPQLADIEAKEIVPDKYFNYNNTYRCKIRGMTYNVCISPDNQKLGISDSDNVLAGSGCSVKKPPSYST